MSEPRRTRRRPIVAIDGPAGAGKSTVSRTAAERLGYVLLDTGAIYRCVGLATRRAGHDGAEQVASAAIVRLARALVQRQAIRFEKTNGKQRLGPLSLNEAWRLCIIP